MSNRRVTGFALLIVPLSLLLIVMGVFMAWYVPLVILGVIGIGVAMAAGAILIMED